MFEKFPNNKNTNPITARNGRKAAKAAAAAAAAKRAELSNYPI